jgi:hypothetical protein
VRTGDEFNLAQICGELRQEFSECDTNNHAQENPQSQVALEEREPLG